ncbi:MAG: helix-hairpin-helix domain-containing protein [Nitrospirota bacterium]
MQFIPGGRIMKRFSFVVLGFWILLTCSGAPSILLGPPLATAADKADLLDINTATAEQLKALPGIGDAYSEKIITGHPYQRKDELAQKKILPRATYEGIKYKIVAEHK